MSLSFDRCLQVHPYWLSTLRLLPSPPDDSSEAARLHHQQGLRCVEARQLTDAVLHFERAVESDPNLGPGWAALALICSLARHEPQAEHAARQALALQCEVPGGLVSLALMQATWGQGKPIEGAFRFDSLQSDGETQVDVLLAALPPIDSAQFTHPEHDRPIVFIYCDHAYCLEHSMTLIWSIAEAKSTCAIHLHVANPGRRLEGMLETIRRQIAPLPLFISYESVFAHMYTGPTVYHSCVRFCRMFQLLRANRNPVVMIDADSLVRRGLEHCPGLMDRPISVAVPVADYYIAEKRGTKTLVGRPFDVGTCHMIAEPIWQEFAGGIFWAKPTLAGLAFTAQLVSFVLDNLLHGTGRWFLDQVGLYACHQKLAGRTAIAQLPPEQFIDLAHGPDSSLWVVTVQKNAAGAYNAYKTSLKSKYGFDALVSEETYGLEIVKTIYGAMFINRADRYIGPSLKATGAWCRHEIDLLQSLNLDGLTVIDAGANIGSHTLAFSKFVGRHGRVYAFEPQRLVYQLLTANLAANGITNVFSFNKGLASKPGLMSVAPPHEANNFGAVRLHPIGAATSETSEVITLDSLNLESCHLIKMDIEGMELEAMLGATQTVRRCRPVLYLENHRGENRSKLIAAVETLGYCVYWHGENTGDPNILCLPNESPIRVGTLERAR